MEVMGKKRRLTIFLLLLLSSHPPPPSECMARIQSIKQYCANGAWPFKILPEFFNRQSTASNTESPVAGLHEPMGSTT